jgi:hypothetical protein
MMPPPLVSLLGEQMVTGDSSVFRTLSFLALLAGLSLGLAAPARADRLDAKLTEALPRSGNFLMDTGYKNVGVLRFRAQRGTGKLGFGVGPINGNMVERVENLLILHTGSDKGPTIGITHEAGGAAQGVGVGAWFSDETQRKKLFDASYPLAWGTDSVKVDAFLTGKVVNTGDRKKTTVAIESFTKTDLEPKPVVEFSFDTDSSLVRDLGYNFALSGEQQQRAEASVKEKKEQVLDDLVITQALEGEKKPEKPRPDVKPGQEGRITPDDIAGIKFEMTVARKPVAIAENPGDARYQVSCPEKGQPMVIYLTNTTDKTLGVVLKVAGLNTLDQETDDSINCRKWVIAPGKRFDIRGFYSGEKADKRVPFGVLDGEAARKISSQVGERAQFIQVDVFRESTGSNPKLISARGMNPVARNLARTSHAALYRQLMGSSGLVKRRGPGGETIIGPAASGEKDAPPSEVVDFRGPVLIGSLAIRVVPGDATATSLDPDENPRD